jgi:hypothetical protein
VVVQVDVVNNLAEGLVADLATEVHGESIAPAPLVVLEILREVGGLVRNDALMCLNFDCGDEYLLFLPPVALTDLDQWVL